MHCNVQFAWRIVFRIVFDWLGIPCQMIMRQQDFNKEHAIKKTVCAFPSALRVTADGKWKQLLSIVAQRVPHCSNAQVATTSTRVA